MLMLIITHFNSLLKPNTINIVEQSTQHRHYRHHQQQHKHKHKLEHSITVSHEQTMYVLPHSGLDSAGHFGWKAFPYRN